MIFIQFACSSVGRQSNWVTSHWILLLLVQSPINWFVTVWFHFLSSLSLSLSLSLWSSWPQQPKCHTMAFHVEQTVMHYSRLSDAIMPLWPLLIKWHASNCQLHTIVYECYMNCIYTKNINKNCTLYTIIDMNIHTHIYI